MVSKIQTEPHVCDEKGCTSTDTMPVWLEPGDEPDGYYCGEHIEQAGFCKGCGQFSAGIESFSFGDFPGFCDNCAEEIRYEEALEAGDFDDDLDDDFDEDEYPFADELDDGTNFF